MRIEELSIGDWVQDKNGKYAQILGIENWSDGYVLNVRINGVDIGCVSASSAHPIPLTPEILEKNECLHTAENRILCDWFDGRITVRKYNNREWYELFVGSNQMKFKLMFVHQLQHALRLAGIEKEIEV